MAVESICVLGLGYIGLPMASTFATNGFKVVGVDVNHDVVEVLQKGEIHIHEPGLRDLVESAFNSGNLKVREEPESSDAFIVAVPTPIQEDKSADLSYVVSATESIIPHLRKGNLVILESTSPPRTTVDVVAPILERSGLKAGSDFNLAYSPERVLPGRILQELTENARVIGGIDQASAEAGRDLYASFVRGDILLTNATTAETVKLLENTYRDVNIALANEVALIAEQLGVDIYQTIEMANLHPRVDILRPGPGVGGHCVSVDPWFLVDAAPDIAALIRQARQVNDSQPAYVVDLIDKTCGGLDRRKIAVLGLAYKPDVDDVRESPAMEIAASLAEKGALVSAFDPYVSEAVVPGAVTSSTLEKALTEAEVVVLLVDHEEFKTLDPVWTAGQMAGRIAIDTRGVWKREDWEEAGLSLRTLGVGL